MRIMEEGILKPRYFTCRVCGCEFIAEPGEYTIAITDEAAIAYYYMCCPKCCCNTNKSRELEWYEYITE